MDTVLTIQLPQLVPSHWCPWQVLEWAQGILAAGEAFSGVECISLRSMLTAQSSNFFTAYHSGNLEALHSMLEKELWRRLPSLPSGDSTIHDMTRHNRTRMDEWMRGVYE